MSATACSKPAVLAAGVAALVARSLLMVTVLTVVGAAYLVWLGIATLARPSAPDAGAERPADSWVRQAMTGVRTSALNPKVFLLFLALLPQFTDPDAGWPLVVQIVALGLIHVVSCAVVYTGVVAGARLVLRVQPAAARVVTRISGAAMVGIGVLLMVERLIA